MCSKKILENISINNLCFGTHIRFFFLFNPLNSTLMGQDGNKKNSLLFII